MLVIVVVDVIVDVDVDVVVGALLRCASDLLIPAMVSANTFAIKYADTLYVPAARSRNVSKRSAGKALITANAPNTPNNNRNNINRE